MTLMELTNRTRYYYFIAGVLSRQQSDPLCGRCKAFANSVESIRESLIEFEHSCRDELIKMPPEVQGLLEHARNAVKVINPPQNAVGQKKAGNCKMPEGVCFVKTSKKIVELI